MDGLLITRAALHALLTDAHRAMLEHRPEFVGAVLHVLRRATAPEFAAGAGLARRLAQETEVAAGGGNGERGDGAEPIGKADAPPVPQAGTPAPPIFHAPSLAAEEAQPAHAHHLPDGPGPGFQPGCTPSAEAPPIAAAPAPAPAQAAGGATSPRVKRTPPPAPRRGWRVAYTDAQKARLRELWPRLDVSATAIRKALSKMDGPAVNSNATLYRLAAQLGLRLRSVLRDEQREATETAAMADLPPAREEPAELRHDQAQRVPSLPARQGDEKAEAFDAFDAGQSVRDVAADTGTPLSTLSNWHAEWKLRRRGTAA
jgi:hypothetical protein